MNKAFAKSDCCPFCTLRNELEENELELIMGASMMEPDIRKRTNKQGFCHKHFGKMFSMKNRLGLGLILESHLEEIKAGVKCKGGLLNRDSSDKAISFCNKLTDDCYVCSQVEEKFSKMVRTAAYLWKEEREFRENLKKQPYFCIPHYSVFLETASDIIPKKEFLTFIEDIDSVLSLYLSSLKDDVSHFCKKFDYRYEDEPWGNSKDSVERAIKFLGEK